ncbi:MAG: hypothetical protein ABEH66_07080 [Halobacteriales archaeon]
MAGNGSPTATPTPWYRGACHELEPRGVPAAPANLTNESVVPFLEAYANASHWNEQFAGEAYARAEVDTNGFVVTRTETGYIVHVGRQVSTLSCDGVHGDPSRFGHGYDYFINESVLAVTDTGVGVRNASVHPAVSVAEILRNGTVVERWNRTR